jgi:hypothetical protein
MENIPKQESVVEKADKFVKEIIKTMRENPLYSANAEKISKELEEKWDTLKASAKNERAGKQIQEFIENNLAEELFKTEEFDPSDEDFYVSNMKNGQRINSNPVYGNKENEIVSYRYIKTPTNPSTEQISVANEINTKYEEESHKSFANSWKIKEELFNEKIKNGEMVFLGEMPWDEYIKLRTSNKPEAHQIKYELTPVFDENQITWSKDKERVYAYTGNEKSE